MESAKILMVSSDDPQMEKVRQQLLELNYQVEEIKDGTAWQEATARLKPDLILVDVEAPGTEGPEICAKLKAAVADNFIPLILATPRGDVESKVRGLELGADDTLVKPIYPEEVSARVKSLLRIKRLQDVLQAKNEEMVNINRQLQQAYNEIDLDLRLAQKLQHSLLPQELPELPEVAFATRYVTSGTMAGDFYDVFRLDESHVGFYVADAVGHGVRAALLTVFLKKGLRTKEISFNSYRLLTPAEVLAELNRDMLSQRLSERPFITMCYCTMDLKDHTLRFASGGHPPPVLVHSRDQSFELLAGEGALLGVFDANYITYEKELFAGDRMVLYTDGLEDARGPGGGGGLRAFYQQLARNSHLSLEQMLEVTLQELFENPTEGGVRDDIALVATEVTARDSS